MYLLAQRSLDLACSQERAFDYAADLTNFPRWFPGVVEIAPEDALSFATLGKAYRETVDVPLRGRRSVLIRVIEIARPHRLVTEGSLAVLRPRMEIEVEALGPAACRLTWRMLSRNESRWARWTVLPWARRVMGRRALIGLHRLEAVLEVG
jgi:hypothetical protein